MRKEIDLSSSWVLLIIVLMLFALSGCAVFDRDKPPPGVEEVKPRDVTPARLIESYTAVSATSELAQVAARTGAIVKSQAQKISQLLKIALAAVDRSTDLWIEGDKSKAANALEAAAAAVEEARKQAKADTSKGGK